MISWLTKLFTCSFIFCSLSKVIEQYLTCMYSYNFISFLWNSQTEKAVGINYTPLKVFKILQKLRAKESFQFGEMRVFRDGDLLMYTRKAKGFPGYLVAINFGNNSVTESFYKSTGISPQVKVVFHSHKQDNAAINLSHNSYILSPNHAVVLEYE